MVPDDVLTMGNNNFGSKKGSIVLQKQQNDGKFSRAPAIPQSHLENVARPPNTTNANNIMTMIDFILF